MPDNVIQSVEQLGRCDGQPNLLTFIDKHGQELLEPEIEQSECEFDEVLSMDSTQDEHITGVDPARPPTTDQIIMDTDVPDQPIRWYPDVDEAFYQVPQTATVPEMQH